MESETEGEEVSPLSLLLSLRLSLPLSVFIAPPPLSHFLPLSLITQIQPVSCMLVPVLYNVHVLHLSLANSLTHTLKHARTHSMYMSQAILTPFWLCLYACLLILFCLMYRSE